MGHVTSIIMWAQESAADGHRQEGGGDEKCDQLWLLNGSQMGLEEVREWQRPCENKRDVVDVGQKSQKSCTAAANGAIFIYE